DRSIATASDQSVRSVLTPLARLAQDHSCAILMVRHLSKKGRHAIYRGGGSIGILGACRSAWLTGRDPTDPSRFILAQTKSNLAAQLPALAYKINDNVVARVSRPCHSGEQVVPRFCRPCPSDPLGVLGGEAHTEGPLQTSHFTLRTAPLLWLGPCTI